jgi:ATP-dependent exoDNAse (exonuclease V) alpha subunit
MGAEVELLRQQLYSAKGVNCLLCAPTGRAAERMTESTGIEAKTIHRLLEVDPASGRFGKNESNRLDCDLLIIAETHDGMFSSSDDEIFLLVASRDILV